MNTSHLKKIGVFAAHSLFVAGLFIPVAVFAQTPPAAQPGNTSVTNSAVTAPTTNTANSQAGGASGNFVPLTQLPGITSISQADSFSTFLNTLYKICIGAGAVLAVIMIMYAGVLFMTSQGSVSSNEKAKSYIQNALLGLLLVLTPTIVFGIINPSILNIDIGGEFKKLATQLHQAESGSATNQVDVGATTLGACNITADTAQSACINSAINTQVSNYNNCVITKPGTDCVTPVKTATPAAAKTCIPSLTSDQTSCLANQWGNAMTSGITKKTNSCSIYDSFKTVVDPNNDPNICGGGGYQKITSPGQCTPQNNGGAGCAVDLRGEACCGHVAQTQYLLAYHFDRTPSSGGKSCVSYTTGAYYSSLDACTTQMNFVKNNPGAIGSETTTGSNLVFDKTCVAVSNQDYKPPVVANACKTN
ncbi:MAG TPA: hypothetical protein VN086_02395 [Candidatus Paceibacterota bacterium]|nr:hypothetical protein [Candidatus Paceibacterota bacterium]